MSPKKSIIIIFTLLLLTVSAVIFLSNFTKQTVRRLAKAEFLNLLSEISKGTVMAIENDLNATRMMLTYLGEDIKYHDFYRDHNAYKDGYSSLHRGYEYISANDIGFMDENGILMYNANAPEIIGIDLSSREYFTVIKDKKDPDYIHIQSIEFKGVDKGDKGMIFAKGVFDKELNFNGISVITSNMKNVIYKYVQPLNVGKNGYFWFVDSDGTILYHPKLYSGKKYDEVKESKTLSESFKLAILDITSKNEKKGAFVEEGETYIYATNSVKVGNKTWYVVASIPEAETTAILVEYSTISLLLTLASLLAVCILGVFFITVFYLKNQKLLQNADMDAYQLELAYRSTKDLDSLINTLAHDLKNPLTSVIGFSDQLLLRLEERPLGRDDSHYLQRVSVNANYMKELINSLLEYSRVGRITNDISEVNLKNVFDDVKIHLHYQIYSRNVKLTIPDEMPIIQVDNLKIIQVFSNIISNAIKFVPEDKTPEVTIEVQEEQNSWHVSVTDNGIGIPEYELDKVFNVFHRTKDLDVPGTGVGLAIVKKIVEDSGGKVSIRSEEPEGTTFTVSLPKQPQVSEK